MLDKWQLFPSRELWFFEEDAHYLTEILALPQSYFLVLSNFHYGRTRTLKTPFNKTRTAKHSQTAIKAVIFLKK